MRRLGTFTLLALLLPAMLPQGTGAAQGLAAEGIEQAPDDDDDDTYFEDDGSGALAGAAVPDAVSGLVPVSPAEEEALLGDWGDSAGESED